MLYKLIGKCLYPKFWSIYISTLIVIVILSALAGGVLALSAIVSIKVVANVIFYEVETFFISFFVYLCLILLFRFTWPKE